MLHLIEKEKEILLSINLRTTRFAVYPKVIPSKFHAERVVEILLQSRDQCQRVNLEFPLPTRYRKACLLGLPII